MKSNPVIKIEYSGKEPASSRANYRKKDRIVDPGFPVDPMGYWNPANIGQIVQVPTEDGHITMRGVDQPLWGMDEYGNTQYQEPGKEYYYKGKFITEYPIAKNGGWLDTMQKGGINMSKVRMDFYPKSQIEAQEQLDYQTRSELAWQKQQEENKKKSIAEGVKKGIPKKQAEAIALSQENPRDQGEIKENIPQSGLSKFIEIASNPVTAMEDYVRSGYNRLPDHFSSNTDRDMLSPTGIANMGYQFLTPLGRTAWAAQSADNADDAVKAGDYTGAAINAAFVLPGLGEGKKFAQTVNKLNRVKNINNIRKAKNTFTFNPEVLKAQQQSLQEARTLKGLPAGSKVLDEAKKYEEYLAEKNAWHQKAIKEHRLNQEQYLRDSDIKQQNFWEYPPIELEQPRRWEQVPIKDDKRVISSMNFNRQSSGFPPIEDDAFDSVQRVSGFESADMERAIREAEERAFQRDMEAAEARYESNQLQAPPSELHIPGTEEFYNPVSGTYETVFNSNTPDKLRTFAEFNNYYDDLGINKNYVNRVLRHKFGENVSVKTINKLLEKNPDLKVGQINKIHNALQDYMNSYKGSAEIDGVKNRSGISKLVALSTASIKDKEKLSKMSAKDFSQTVLKPTGEIVPYKQAKDLEEIGYNTATRNLQLKNVIPMSNQEYAEVFNERLDLLNDIIKKNNKSGLEYNVKKLSPDGRLIFETPSMPGADQSWQTNINPGQWRGDVEDIANTEYFRSIPGLEMSNTTSSVFGDRQPRKGSRTYESINEYLKSIDLGRVKPGFNSQTTYSKGLWEDAIKKDKAHGFYSNPNTVYGAMKSVLPYVGTGVLGAGALNQEQNGGWLDDEEFRRGGQKGLKKFTSKNIATSVNDIMMRNETLFGKPGKKRYKPGLKFQDGGEGTLNEDQQFLTNMANSPLFNERYAKMTGQNLPIPYKKDHEESAYNINYPADQYKKDIINNVASVKYAPKGEGDFKNETLNGYYMPNISDTKVQDLKNVIKNSKKYKFDTKILEDAITNKHTVFLNKNSEPYTKLHETSHASTEGELNPVNNYNYRFQIPPNQYNELGFKKYSADKNYYEKADIKNYLTIPTERKARIDVGRKILMDQKQYDPINEKFNEKHYNKLFDTENDNVKDLLHNYSKEDIIKMFNETVSTKPKAQPVAKIGGWLDNIV